MKKLYSLVSIFCFLLLTAQAYSSNYMLMKRAEGAIDTSKRAATATKITDTRRDKPSYLKAGVNVSIVPFKPGVVKTLPAGSSGSVQTSRSLSPDVKVLSNVKVYPNPVDDQLNLSYYVNKESNVTIKIMDVLGNEIATLLSQKMPAGEQINSFPIASKLSSGYYFIRLMVGNETVVKRISVL